MKVRLCLHLCPRLASFYTAALRPFAVGTRSSMSSRNLTALAVAVVVGVAGGMCFRPLNPEQMLSAKVLMSVGVYTFSPLLKEQQKAQEAWKNPRYKSHAFPP